MCNPVAAMWVGTALNVGSTVYSANQQNAQGKTMQEQYNYLADQEQQKVYQETRNIGDAASYGVKQNIMNAKEVAGLQQAASGASGVDSNVLMNDTAYKSKLDQMIILRNANVDIAGIDNQSESLRRTGNAYRRQASDNATASLIGGATAVANNWLEWGKTSGGKTKPKGGTIK